MSGLDTVLINAGLLACALVLLLMAVAVELFGDTLLAWVLARAVLLPASAWIYVRARVRGEDAGGGLMPSITRRVPPPTGVSR